jgi:aminoglycoside 6-adenylyltransferase
VFTRPPKVTERADEVVDQLIRWADSQDLIRGVILTSSRAIPHSSVDPFSDYDVILVMRSIHPFYADRIWR